MASASSAGPQAWDGGMRTWLTRIMCARFVHPAHLAPHHHESFAPPGWGAKCVEQSGG